MKSFARPLFPLLPDLVFLLPDSAPSLQLASLEPEQEKRRLFEALTQFFTRQALKQPVLLIIEDMHWSDDTSLEYLHYLARRCAAHPLLVLLTYRSDEVRSRLRQWLAEFDRERLAQELSLSPLTRNHVDAMLRVIFDIQQPIHAEALAALYTLTEGNPFFIEEVLSSLIATGVIFYAHGAWDGKSMRELRVPRSIKNAVQQRTERLSPAARELLVLAAVAGQRFDFALLQQVLQREEHQLLPLIKELITAQLVVEESAEQFAFRHALTRQAISAELLARERKALHRTTAETMEHLYTTTRDAHLADLAYHFYEAGVWAKALEYEQRAGERAQSLHAPRAAIEHLTHALDAAQQLHVMPPAQIYHARGQAYETLGEFERARSDHERALEAAHTAHDTRMEWQSMMALGFLWAGRDYTQAGGWFRRAGELAERLADPTCVPAVSIV